MNKQELKQRIHESLKADVDEHNEPAIAQKAIDDHKTKDTAFGPRPLSRGRYYAIARLDGTFLKTQVDQTGANLIDVNKLMERIDPSGKEFNKAVKNGLVSDAGMSYGDFTNGPSYQEALNIVMHAEEQFKLLPVALRNRFQNDPSLFLDYMNDPKNVEEHIQLGLRIKKEEPKPDMRNEDIVNAIRETAGNKKPAGKGGNTDGSE